MHAVPYLAFKSWLGTRVAHYIEVYAYNLGNDEKRFQITWRVFDYHLALLADTWAREHLTMEHTLDRTVVMVCR